MYDLSRLTHFKTGASAYLLQREIGAARLEEPSPVFFKGQWYLYAAAWTAPHVGEAAEGMIVVYRGSRLDQLKYIGIALGAGGDGSWDSKYVSGPKARVFDDVLHLYYFGSQVASVEGEPASIGVATSIDGISFVRKEMLLAPGKAGEWDSKILYRPEIVYEFAKYWLFYNAKSDSDLKERIGVATGRHPLGPFTKLGETFLIDLPSWGTSRIGDIDIMRRGNGFVAQVFAQTDPAPGRVGYYFSANLTEWVSYAENPITVPGDAPVLIRGAWADDGNNLFVFYDDVGAGGIHMAILQDNSSASSSDRSSKASFPKAL